MFSMYAKPQLKEDRFTPCKESVMILCSGRYVCVCVCVCVREREREREREITKIQKNRKLYYH